MYAKVAGGILAYVAGLAILTMACLYDLNATTSMHPRVSDASAVAVEAR